MSEHRSIKGRGRVLREFLWSLWWIPLLWKETVYIYIRERNWGGILEGLGMIGNECFVDVWWMNERMENSKIYSKRIIHHFFRISNELEISCLVIQSFCFQLKIINTVTWLYYWYGTVSNIFAPNQSILCNYYKLLNYFNIKIYPSNVTVKRNGYLEDIFHKFSLSIISLSNRFVFSYRNVDVTVQR